MFDVSVFLERLANFLSKISLTLCLQNKSNQILFQSVDHEVSGRKLTNTVSIYCFVLNLIKGLNRNMNLENANIINTIVKIQK